MQQRWWRGLAGEEEDDDAGEAALGASLSCSI